MTTISNTSQSSVFEHSTPATNAGNFIGKKSNAGVAQAAASLPSVENTSASLGASPPLPLTYNASGQLNSLPQAAPAKSTAATTSVQAAKDAILAAENAVTETLNSLISGPSSNSSAPDTSALFGLPGTSAVNNPLELAKGSLLNASTNGSSGAQTAQNAILAAENAVTETLGSLVSPLPSNSSGSGI